MPHRQNARPQTRTTWIGRFFPLLSAMVLAAFTIGDAVAQGASIRLSDRFDAGQISREEARILQGALALEGSYDALLDGAWGQGSRTALDEWVRTANGGRTATWRDIRALTRRFEAERRASGWTGVWHADVGVWHMRPDALLEDRSDGRENRWASPDGGLVVIARPAFVRPEELHDEFARDARRDTRPYRLSNDGRIVTAAEMRGGRYAYVRSDRARSATAGTPWITHIIIADAANRDRLQLIASSFARNRQGDLDPQNTRILSALIGADSTLPDPDPAPRTSDGSGDTLEQVLTAILSRGFGRLDDRDGDEATRRARDVVTAAREAERARTVSAVFVNTTDLLASDRMETVCDGRVRRGNGARLSLIARDADLGLALYSAPGRSADWVPLTLGLPRPGDTATLALRTLEGQVQSSRGSIASQRGDSDLTVAVDVPAQEVQAAPLLDRSRALIGVWTGTRDRQGRLEAVAAGDLIGFLDRQNIPFGTPSGAQTASPGISEATSRAIVSLHCD